MLDRFLWMPMAHVILPPLLGALHVRDVLVRVSVRVRGWARLVFAAPDPDPVKE